MDSAENARALLKENGVKQVLCAFSDLRGYLMTFSIPAREFIEGDAFEGLGFDGSSIRGFKSIEQSDMVWVADPKTIRVVPWISDPTQKSAIMFGDVYEAWASGIAECDPRGYVAKRIENELEKQGMSAVFGPEIEFFVFQNVDFKNLAWDLWVSPNGGAGDSWGAP
ncbi:MAG: glutamine synthetase beta-grasp domain-containing protein, partial [Archaeoglobi archaeon]|nr:glutamine synthetase beta-grasp domain-containing protein [Archaeoglobi archaeon]